MERYRRGHNGADSKAARFRHSVQRESSGFLAKAPFSCGFRDFGLQEKEKAPYSCLSKFAQKSNTERYRRGHNGADSKSVCARAHKGSNPFLSAISRKRLEVISGLFLFGFESRPSAICTICNLFFKGLQIFLSRNQNLRLSFLGPQILL